MSAVSRDFVSVWYEDGKCPNEKWHFHGAAREVYSYMKLLAERTGGFVYASIPDIVKHTKQWRHEDRRPFTRRHCERIIRAFRALHILGEYQVLIHGRKYRGWQMAKHEDWTEEVGGRCEFKNWADFEFESQFGAMGNESVFQGS